MDHTRVRPATRGIHHLGLTVKNVRSARDFFVNVLNFELVGERKDYPAVFVTDHKTMLTLWQAETPKKAVRFDRKNNIGLHHVALLVEGIDALRALHERLADTPGVKIEFAPQPVGGSDSRHMMVEIPGGVRVEFISPARTGL